MKSIIKQKISSWRAKSIYLLLTGITAVSFLISCDDEGKNRGVGYVSLSLRTDTAFATTKAGNPEDVNEYIIQILQGQTVVNKFPYAEKPDELKLDAGTYTASATWGSDVAAAFDALYMEGSSEFVIKEDMTTTIELAPTPANVKVVVDFSSELGEVYDDYYIDTTTGQTGDTPLVYKKVKPVRHILLRLL